MKCIAIDDEPLALNIIKDFCSKIEFINLVATCHSAVEAIKIINSQEIDLIFLDIQMPHITGLEFIRTIKYAPLTIFTTAYSEHALEGFEVDAIDYLVKPIPFERFFKAANKAYELYCLKNKDTQAQATSLTEIAPKSNQQTIDYILVKTDYSTIRVDLKDIQYIEGVKDYIKIVVNGKSVLTKSTMKNIEEKLLSTDFIRVHKSFIISMTRIDKIENNRIVFGEKYIPIGHNYRKQFYDLVEKYRL